ncbi:hypothetical protein [Lewinella sp. IMCC34183]|uniref:hypothetical protein n=1 Tax=Lewinella sp. IMCC34183 TaxID=2248762 RepID=UPI000E268CE7|nr:hypothetical protein [Lewinella sp. IMCC34183]
MSASRLPPTVAILGTGWLGLPLLTDLAGDHAIRGSCRSPSGAEAIRAAGGQPYDIDLPAAAGELPAFLDGADTLVITLPPGGRTHGERTTEYYLSALAPLAPFLRNGLHVLYTSSTGVYGNAVTGTVTETTPVAPDTASSRATVAAERWLREHAPSLAILRLGGLFGPGRDPIDFFRRREAIPEADAPVNLIGQQRAVAALRFVITRRVTGIFNLCAADHPSKREFYGDRYRAAGRPPKPFLPGGGAGKRIDSTKFRLLGGPEL